MCFGMADSKTLGHHFEVILRHSSANLTSALRFRHRFFKKMATCEQGLPPPSVGQMTSPLASGGTGTKLGTLLLMKIRYGY